MTATDETVATTRHRAPDAGLGTLLAETRRLLGCAADDVPAGVGVADWLRISRVVEATGDDNPLYLDLHHGARSWWRTLVAPPCFVLAVAVPESSGALDARDHDAVDVLARVELWWRDHVRLGQRVGADLRIAGAAGGPRWRGRDTVDVTTTAVYRADGREVAGGTGVVRVHPLRLGSESFVERAMHRYGEDEIAEIAAALDAEPPVRGARPRHHGDVSPGERLPALVRGPVTWSELISWLVAEGRPYPAGNLRHRALAERPGAVRPHPATGWPVSDRRQARDSLVACADVGFPAPAARGSLVVALLSRHVTGWMGDDAFLRHLDATLDAPVLYGDTLRLTGEVVDTFVQRVGGREYAAASLALAAHNQIGERVAHATALVYLPRPGRPVLLPVGEDPA